MTPQQALAIVRSELKGLAAAAAETCLRNQAERARSKAPLEALDMLAESLAAPGLHALELVSIALPTLPADVRRREELASLELEGLEEQIEATAFQPSVPAEHLEHL